MENMTFNTLASDLSDYNAKVNKIFACGNKIVFGENLTMDNPIDIFGGHSVNHTVESTDLTVKKRYVQKNLRRRRAVGSNGRYAY
ncbi:MAG: hypothetical protein L6V93_04890 [Clostridiales bacterium]|nr:MAG: hypothetical protein L6V93_04890 [Clostridiales bacterium]